MEAPSHDTFLAHYEEHSDAIFRMCYFRTNDRDIALDLTQDTFIKVWDYLQEGKTVSNLKAFTYTVARNLIKDYYKRKKPISVGTLDEMELFLNQHGYNISTNTDSNIELELALSLLDKLSHSEKKLLTYKLIDELSPKEIAELTGERENTISVRIHRALAKYKILLKETM